MISPKTRTNPPCKKDRTQKGTTPLSCLSKRRKSLAGRHQPKNSLRNQEIRGQTIRTFYHYRSNIPSSGTTENPRSLENPRRLPHLPYLSLYGNTRTRSQFHRTTSGTYRRRSGVRSRKSAGSTAIRKKEDSRVPSKLERVLRCTQLLGTR
jgi:hypothetical protein